MNHSAHDPQATETNNEFASSYDKASTIFRKDDYEEVNETYFASILRTNKWSSLPAGWLNPYSKAASTYFPVAAPIERLQHYAVDEGSSLGVAKQRILELISAWEGRLVNEGELTLLPSVSTASLAVLLALRSRGINRIVFETPCYFGTLDQARLLNFEINRVPSYRSDGFRIAPEAYVDYLAGRAPSAIWLTHPRFGIGSNQDLDTIMRVLGVLRSDDVLVIDEAAEQNFPSTLSLLEADNPSVIRLRGLFKGIGLNGMRLAFALHPEQWRPDMESILDAAGASLDQYSLANAASLAAGKDIFQAMLKQANMQVNRLRGMLDMMCLGSWITPTPLVNGYIAAILLDFSGFSGSYADKRTALLDLCRKRKMPIVTRASIGFAHDDAWEAVRINYFTSEQNVIASAQCLIDLYPELQSSFPQMRRPAVP